MKVANNENNFGLCYLNKQEINCFVHIKIWSGDREVKVDV